MKNIDERSQEAQKTPSKINIKRAISRCNIV